MVNYRLDIKISFSKLYKTALLIELLSEFLEKHISYLHNQTKNNKNSEGGFAGMDFVTSVIDSIAIE